MMSSEASRGEGLGCGQPACLPAWQCPRFSLATRTCAAPYVCIPRPPFSKQKHVCLQACYRLFPLITHASVPLHIEDQEPAGLSVLNRLSDAGPASGRRRCAEDKGGSIHKGAGMGGTAGSLLRVCLLAAALALCHSNTTPACARPPPSHPSAPPPGRVAAGAPPPPTAPPAPPRARCCPTPPPAPPTCAGTCCASTRQRCCWRSVREPAARVAHTFHRTQVLMAQLCSSAASPQPSHPGVDPIRGTAFS